MPHLRMLQVLLFKLRSNEMAKDPFVPLAGWLRGVGLH